MSKRRKKNQISLTRNAINDRILQLGVSRFQIASSGLVSAAPSTIYRFLNGETECTSGIVDDLFQALGLRIEASHTPGWVVDRSRLTTVGKCQSAEEVVGDQAHRVQGDSAYNDAAKYKPRSLKSRDHLSGSPQRTKAWTETDFVAHIDAEYGSEAAQTVTSVIAECRSIGGVVEGGSFALIPAWPITENPSTKRNADWVWPFYILDDARIAIIWQFMKPPFDQVQYRMKLLERLRAIPGVSLEDNEIRGRPTFPLDAIRQSKQLIQFFEAFEWMRSEVKAVS